ncbi:hypothetical protein L383_01850 [Enterobacter sp. MGH 37]|uniref:hypothetical protein n=1 Tax=unclassified Enterobacter cloacae complex TaxID=2757714 RepID=UPI0003BE0197|nr:MULTISPECIES: hypothetical protein [unclassified Enterobacter cloacae complex]ESN30882.1 hypothetical protein L371_00747 [Enterobacter sp. MGH 25]EUM46461.1 hypothetical protein L383_01850 [Enterobacter sp. MGH 37]
MSTITKEQLRERAREKVKSLEFAVTQAAFADSRAELEEELELARIALASLEAGPAIHRWRRVTSEPYGPYPWHYGDFIGFSKPVDGIEDEYFYSAPPAPAPVSDEDKVLAEQARAVIHCLDMCGVPSGDYADNEQLQLWGRVIEYGRHPASVSVPAAMEMDDDFDSAFEHGKAVGWNAYRAAMLQGANGTLTNEGTIPVTQFKPVADLYGLTSPTGGETSFTFDAVEARDFIDGGWSCQEYVELERFQEAVSGNSPVIPDGFCIMPKKLTAENGGKGALSGEFHVTNRIVCQSCGGEGCEDCNDEGGWDAEIPVSWDTIKRIHEAAVEACSLPAAPQQEVK